MKWPFRKNVKVLQQDTWIVDRKFLKMCLRARGESDNIINYPACGIWTADFMVQQKKAERS